MLNNDSARLTSEWAERDKHPFEQQLNKNISNRLIFLVSSAQ